MYIIFRVMMSIWHILNPDLPRELKMLMSSWSKLILVPVGMFKLLWIISRTNLTISKLLQGKSWFERIKNSWQVHISDFGQIQPKWGAVALKYVYLLKVLTKF